MRIANVMRRIQHGQWAYLFHALKIRMRGIDLSGETLEQIGLPSDRAHSHAQSGGPELAAVLKTIGVPAGSRIIDFGSGKGGAVLTLEQCGFAEVVAIELSSKIHAIALANAAKAHSKATFLCGDAISIVSPELDRFTHAYMFNPFPPAVVSQVLHNLAQSAAKKPRRLTLILKWPCAGPDDLVALFPFRKTREFRPPQSHAFYIYEHWIHRP